MDQLKAALELIDKIKKLADGKDRPYRSHARDIYDILTLIRNYKAKK